jgi:hypothetical protein
MVYSGDYYVDRVARAPVHLIRIMPLGQICNEEKVL